jgi:hypothetical protein
MGPHLRMLLRVLGVGLLFPFFVSATQWGNQYCETDKLPVVLLHRNASTGVFTLVKRIPSNETNFEEGAFRKNRRLERNDFMVVADDETTNLPSDWVPGLLLEEEEPRRLQNEYFFDNEISAPANDLDDPAEAPTSATIAPQIQDDEDPPAANDMPENTNADDDEEEYFYARECSCFSNFPTVYCPFVADVCQQPSSDQQLPGCLTLAENEQHENQSRVLTYLTIFGFWIVGGLCLLTKYGRSGLDYPLSWCFPGRTRKLTDQMMRQDPHRTSRLLQNFTRRRYRRMERLALETSRQTAWTEEQLRQQQRQDLEAAGVSPLSASDPQEPAVPQPEVPLPSAPSRLPTHASDPLQPVSFSLRTCTFRKADHGSNHSSTGNNNDLDHEDTDESASCAICFAPLLDGERVGALACNHIFHVDCLKMWVQRRNVCPLCNTSEIASPNFAHEVDNPKIPNSATEEEASTDASSNGRSSMQETPSTEASQGESGT